MWLGLCSIQTVHILRVSVGLIAVAACLAAGCGPSDTTPQVTAAIEQIVAGSPTSHVDEQVWADVRQFYAHRANAPRWVRDGKTADGKVTGVASALRVIRQAPDHGLTAGDYDEGALARIADASQTSKNPIKDAFGDDVQAQARFDVRVTTALLALGRDVALGRVNPETIEQRWKARRTPPDLAGTLSMAAGDASSNNASVDGWLNTIRPVHPEYAALQKVLSGARQQREAAGADERTRQIALNMERWRWMPDDLGVHHILVNIPAFHMAVRENGRAVLDMKVVVGKTGHETPVFSGDMSTIVFSPYWNVPDSIAEGETAPAAARDPNYLARNNIEILRVSKSGSTLVDPRKVDWDDADAIKALAFRQKPGAANALGHVKFLFPNKYDVYLHDTPADALFERRGRALSHGCVRLEQPEELAKYVLRGRPEWDQPRIETAMNAGEEKQVALKNKIPVHIVYFTVWPTDSGGVDTWPDVYGYDAKQSASPSTTGRRMAKLN